MNTFFTSDTHFGHANIILYSNRPFLEEGDTYFDEKEQRFKWVNSMAKRSAARRHDAQLIKNFNSIVTENDDIYHCGDFNFGTTSDVVEILRKLTYRNFYFIWGNHDETMKDFKKILGFYPDLNKKIKFLGDMAEVEVEGQKIVLCHYAMRTWNKSHHGVWHLYGHSHGSLPDDPTSLSFDVGVDVHDYRPISFEEVSIYMSKKNYVPIDHHGKREELNLAKENYAKLERKRQFEMLLKEFGNSVDTKPKH